MIQDLHGGVSALSTSEKQESFEAVAARLRAAYASGAVAPLRDILGPGDGDGAYKVQAINTALWKNEGRTIVGRKIGLTAKSVQAQLGVNQPDFGVLFADMRIAEGGRLAPSSVLQPKAEAEIAFVLGKDLDQASITLEQMADAVDYVVAAIEIVDSRITDWKITFADTVADNGSSAFYVLGNDRKKVADVDLYTCGMALEVNGSLASLGAGAACLGHPMNAALWLAQKCAQIGEPLRAGDVILTGALGPMVTLSVGDRVEAKIGGLGSASFVYEEGA